MEFNKETTVCFSGYRPQKFDFPLCGDRYEGFRAALLDEIKKAIDCGYTTHLVGMAPGFDVISCEASIEAKQLFPQSTIRLVCVLPYADFNQSSHFDAHWRKRYDQVLAHSDEIINITGNNGWSSGCYYARNRFMVDNSSLLICYSTGKAGGTEQTMEYARKNNVPIINIA